MTRFSLILLLLTGFLNLISGQIRLGLRFGANVSTVRTHGHCVTGCDLINLNRGNFPAYHFGLSANHQLSTRWSLDTDLIYVRRGYETQMSSASFQPNSEMLINYLSLPLSVNAQYRESPIDFLFGLEPGILLSATNRIDGREENAVEDWSQFDLGLNLGIAYRFKPEFLVKLGYYLGIPSIYGRTFSTTGGSLLNGASLRMRSFQISMYYYAMGMGKEG